MNKIKLEEIFKDDLILTAKELIEKYGLEKCGEAWTLQGQSGIISKKTEFDFKSGINDERNIYK